MLVAEETEKDIDATRLTYVPVAVRTQILFFCVSDLSNVDPMYQYSLEWFLGIFMVGIANAERAGSETIEAPSISFRAAGPSVIYVGPAGQLSSSPSRHGGAADREHQQIFHLQPVLQRVPQLV